ncbi:hypothetical protein MMC11_001039 [Xylographa trunciseda]|nr:hypothetical protein [Xylographa trunciseda]
MTVGPSLGFNLSPSASTTSTNSTTSPPTTTSATSTTSPSPILPTTNHYGGGAPLPSTQTCNTACAIAIPILLLALLTLGVLFAHFKHRHHQKRALASAIAAGSAPANADPACEDRVPDRDTFVQRVRGFCGVTSKGPAAAAAAQTGTLRESRGGRGFSTLRQSVRRDPRARGYVDLEAGQELGHVRSGSAASGASEVTLTEGLVEGQPVEERKLGA